MSGMSETPFIVVRDHPFETRVSPQGYPTPHLISIGRGEAYFVPFEDGVYREDVYGSWRARDDKYDPPGTIYQHVRVIRNPSRSSYDY